MSKSHKKSSSQSTESAQSSAQKGSGWLDQAAGYGNAFVQEMMKGSSEAGSETAAWTETMPISPEWLVGKATNVQESSAGGSIVTVEGAELSFMSSEQATAGAFTGATRGPSQLSGHVYAKNGDARAKLWFEDDDALQVRTELKADPKVDLFDLG
ncbi:MAG: hypothetical protein EP330_23350 [Deltaproteobacteria bacterium]|nr:MAG: hypothetical protein EP330_23350 [Deltaproteobacteria bacterium]